MDGTEKFCLRWNDFESNISGALKGLREDKDFFDVTLACNEEHLKAHKVILSACSPFFRSILRRHRHEHPLLYMKGIQHKEMLHVLNFMYHGEVSVAQDDLNSFLAVAEDLQVKGLTQSNNENSKEKESKKNQDQSYQSDQETNMQQKNLHQATKKHPSSYNSVVPKKKEIKSKHCDDDDDIQEVIPIKTEPQHPPATEKYALATFKNAHEERMVNAVVEDLNSVEQGDTYADYGYDVASENFDDGLYQSNQEGNQKELDDLLEQHIVYNQDFDPSKPWQCTECQKAFKGKGHVKDHIEGTHISGLSFTCPYCSIEITSRHRLRTHISLKHNAEHKERQIKISQLQPSYHAA